jgi:hypothetical protein
MENIWREVKGEMQETWPVLPASRSDERWSLVSDAWDEFALSRYGRSLIQSMTRRMKEVVEVQVFCLYVATERLRPKLLVLIFCAEASYFVKVKHLQIVHVLHSFLSTASESRWGWNGSQVAYFRVGDPQKYLNEIEYDSKYSLFTETFRLIGS